jgi:glutathione S-transferase
VRYGTKAAGAVAMSFANGKIKKKYGIVDERADLRKTLQVWTDAIGQKDFLHGKEPTMPDILVYGTLRAIEGLRTFDEIMNDNEILKKWYERVQKKIPSK